ncbi:MAG: flagellar biosynthesis anti-sigma factor FlgM [Vampirovibrionales bacterium]|nr:flagellar biosynthesis anti-sigma factor FlgM [Vampirovibrionales bacterium]
MVDRINSQSPSVQDLGLLQTSQQTAVENAKVEKANRESGTSKAKLDSLQGFDKASISSEAVSAWEQEKEMLKFSRLAQRETPEVDYEKVSRIKNLVDSGRINDYLSTVDTNALVESMLNSPAGAFLR